MTCLVSFEIVILISLPILFGHTITTPWLASNGFLLWIIFFHFRSNFDENIQYQDALSHIALA
jgi:hypothetical protein